MQDEILDYNDEQKNKPFYDYASFGTRVGASLVDILIFIPIAVFNVYNTLVMKELGLLLAASVIMIAYKPIMEYSYGATLGKMAVRIKVVDEETGNIDFEQAIIRSIPFLLINFISLFAALQLFMDTNFHQLRSMEAYNEAFSSDSYLLISNLANLFLIVSCLFVAFRDTRQALHDSMAGTFVVRK